MFKSLFRSRYGHVAIFVIVWLVAALAMRLTLAARAFSMMDHGLLTVLGTFAVGFAYDLASAAFGCLPFVVYGAIAPRAWLASRFHRAVSLAVFPIVIYGLLFTCVSEWFFWDEFSSRFNFIAVDYLIYTKEVIGNIQESYPLPAILGGLALATAAACFGVWRLGWIQGWFEGAPESTLRWKPLLGFVAAAVLSFFSLSNESVPGFGNAYNQELARNGPYAFFAAYRENSLNYDRFYRVRPLADALKETRSLLTFPDSEFTSSDLTNITRKVTNPGPERHWNVIQITVESLSSAFLGKFGNTNGLTPNLDRLFSEGVVFTNLYATGNRTVRGMEALTLCVPPTPGSSIVRRPHNENLFTLGSVFRSRGYDTAFIYSGFGYFDNMNAYFAANGYRVIDRSSVKPEDITYATVWGACDEDLFRWTLREADAAHAGGKPFHHFVMTTSNHRPYGYPEGRIDLPPGRREGAVKYTDFAIGKLLADARSHPWFTNTVFLIVADHCASSAGRTSLPLNGYQIPAFIWNPDLIQPEHIGHLCSQIDVAPTLLGLMGWNYESRFYGQDARKMRPEDQRAFIATYQNLGYLRPGRMAILEPVRRSRVVDVTVSGETPATGPEADRMLDEAVSAYQSASFLFSNGFNRQ